jgi:peroxiredoxin
MSFHTIQKNEPEPKGLQPGQVAPLFSAKDQHGKVFNLADQLNNQAVVIVFYRGHWCPVCNRHLSALQDSLAIISQHGATLVAVSPEKPELLEKTEQKTSASFHLLYDEGYKISEAYDVAFKPGSGQVAMYNIALGADLKNAHSDESKRLPVPATYIIGKDGKILWKHFNPDYKDRASVKEILKHLPSK